MDNGRSADILYYPAFQQMRLGQDQLRPMNSPLVGFGGMKVQPVGTITLPVVARAYPQQITKFPTEYRVKTSAGRSASSKRMLFGHVSHGRTASNNEH